MNDEIRSYPQSDRGPCMVCGKRSPGHVIVSAHRWTPPDEPLGVREPFGQVCSSHTLAELILHPSDHLTVEVTFGTTEQLERLIAKELQLQTAELPPVTDIRAAMPKGELEVTDSRSWARCDYGPLDQVHDATWEARDRFGPLGRSCDEHRAKMLEEFPPDEGAEIVALATTHKGKEAT